MSMLFRFQTQPNDVFMNQIPTSRNRSRRLRKKLRVDEYQELGFGISMQVSNNLSEQQLDQFWDDFMMLVEQRKLCFGGWETGFIAPANRGTATEDDREAINGWLLARPEVSNITIGQLCDDWYGWD